MDINIDLSKFKVTPPTSLFEPTAWEKKYWIMKQRCPLCFRKLYWNRENTKAFCKSKFKDRFFITKAAFDKLK